MREIMATFLSTQLDFILFFYGLAFLLLGATCLSISRSERGGRILGCARIVRSRTRRGRMARFDCAHYRRQSGIRGGPHRAHDRILHVVDGVCAEERNSVRIEVARAMAVSALGPIGCFRRV